MTPAASVPARALARLEDVASTRLGALGLFFAGLLVYGVQAIAWPLKAGRDLDEYLLVWVQLFDRHVLLPWSLLFRTPVAPIVIGGSLDVVHGALAEPIFGVLFALSVLAWAAAALSFGPRVALATALALLTYPGYGAMFHEVSSEVVLATAFAGWALVVTRAAARPSVARFTFVGLGIASLALIRPGNAVLLLFVLFPLVLRGPWRRRLTWAAACAAAAVLPLIAWSVHNGVRFGDYTLARGGNAIIPFYRAFITDHIISTDNGPASRKLTAAMDRYLLTRDPYKSYGVTTDALFRNGSFRVHEDLYLLSDQVFGWNSAYAVLRDAGIEGVRAHPGVYASGVLGTVWDQLTKPYYRLRASESRVPASKVETVGQSEKLPLPGEGEPIPAGQVVWISTPDQRIRQVWTSPTEWHFEFRHRQDRARFDRIQRDADRLAKALPDRAANAQLAHRFDQLSYRYPRPILWIVAGLIGIAVRRPRGSRTLIALALAAFLVVVLNALGLFADLHFILPVAPAFILLGLGGLLGTRDRVPSTTNPPTA